MAPPQVQCILALILITIMSPVLGIWPQPRDFNTGSTTLLIDSSFTIKYASSSKDVPQDLVNAAKRVEDTLKGILKPNEKPHYYLSPTRGTEFLSIPSGSANPHPILPDLTVHIEDNASIFDQAIKPLEERDEAYSLKVPGDGTGAKIEARTALGAFRGLSSFEMLFYAVPTPYKSKYPSSPSPSPESQTPFSPSSFSAQTSPPLSYTPSAPITIKDDHPRFKWRGFMLDTARHWMGREMIFKMLDGMAMVKLNQFHWHMTDAQSWPLSLEGYREMAEKGAYSPEEVYDEETIDEVVRYAGERGIDVMIEIDVPGHTTSLHASHPSMIAAYNYQPWQEYAACPPGGQIRFMVDEVVDKVVGVLEGLRGRVRGEYMGSGGDEVNEKTYEVDEISQKTLKEKNQTLMQAFDGFMARVSKAVQPKKLVVWQEMIQEHKVDSLPADALIMVWKQSKDVQDIITLDRSLILCPSNFFYLDLGEGPWVVPPTPEEIANHPQNGHYNPWSKIYTFDPYKDIPEEKRGLVLGGQTNMWCERTDEGNVEGKVWPRAAAAAEVFWTGAEPGEYPLDARAALARFQDMRYRLVSKGIRASPLQPHWCAIRPGSC